MAKLGEVCDILNGYAFKSNQYTTSGVRIIRISNVQKGYIEDKSPVYYPCDDENVKKYELKQNDLLISLTGNVGRTALLEEKFLPAALNQRVSCVRLKEPDKVLKTYLFHLLNSDYFEQQCMKAAEGVAQKNLSSKWLFEYKIPIYSIERQKEISNTLDKIDLLIILRKQQLAKLDELVKARFVEMFGDPVSNPMGWKRVRFDSISENLDSKRVPVTEGDRKDGVYPYYGASGIVDWINDYIFDEDILLVSEDGANLLMRSTPIAFSVSGKSWVNNHAHVVRFHDFATQKFIEVYFSLIDISEYITGTAQPKLNQAKLNTMLFCWPPLSLQKQFAAFVERVDQQKQTVQQSLDKLELMKKALMQEYFG